MTADPESASTTAKTRLVLLLGHPVAHSRSPQLHSAAFASAGLDAVYVAADVPPADLAAAVGGLRALGALGANLTIPHKVSVMAHADRVTAEAAAIGAANTLFFQAGDLVADNTDATGLATVLREEVDVHAGTHVVVFGAGGAARAAAVALGRLGCRVSVRARREEAAAEVSALAMTMGAVRADGARPDVVINATPLGLHGEPLPEEFMGLAPGQTALDLLYGIETPFLAAARARGAAAVDGMGMLLGQAEAAYARWTGTAAPEGAYRTPAGAA